MRREVVRQKGVCAVNRSILLLPVSPRLVYLSECLYFFISTPVLVVLLLSLSVHCWLCFLWFFCYFLIFLPFLTLLDLYLSHKDTVIKLLYLSSFTTNLVAFLVSMELSFMDPVAIFKACKETPAPHVRGYQTYVRASLSLSVSIYMHTMYVWMKYKCLTYKTSCYFSPSAFPFFLSLLTFFFPLNSAWRFYFATTLHINTSRKRIRIWIGTLTDTRI